MDPSETETREEKIPEQENLKENRNMEGEAGEGGAPQETPFPPQDAPAPLGEQALTGEQDLPETEEAEGEQTIPDEQLRPIVECLLFTTNEPLSAKKLAGLLENVPTRCVRRIILELKEDYDIHLRGFQIVEVAGGFQMATRPQFAPYILKLNRHKKRNLLSIPALETLAIIAYKQPIIRAEIEAIRGVDSSGVLHNLLELGLLKIVGKKEVVGHPPLYGTTEEFLKVFGLRQIADLPSIREIREMFEQREKMDAPKTEQEEIKANQAEVSPPAEPGTDDPDQQL